MDGCSRFHIFSTAGNTTLFVDKPGAWIYAPRFMGCEQAGYANAEQAILVMAADEFCFNASIAFGPLLSLLGKPASQMRVAGLTVDLQWQGEAPIWQASASVDFGGAEISRADEAVIVRLPGITHVLREGMSGAMQSGDALRILADLGLAQEAAGVVWWEGRGEQAPEILPIVNVPKAQTCNTELACGSASAALALYLGSGKYCIRQQSGEFLRVENDNRRICISAPVKLLAQGQLWR